jgi:hypothetical protein
MVVNSLLVLMRAYGLKDLWSTLQLLFSKFLSTVCELLQNALYIIQALCRGIELSVNGPFHQQQEVSWLQKTYTIWNGIAVEKSS